MVDKGEIIGGNVEEFDRVVVEVEGEEISSEDYDFDEVIECKINELLNYLD